MQPSEKELAVATLVAVTSRDGISVNERFHRAADYFVFARQADVVRFVERRVRPATTARVYRDFSTLAELLADCAWIVSLGFTAEARKELAARGFRLHEARGAIEQVIRGLPLDTLPPSASAADAA